jgi:hypothetical protein
MLQTQNNPATISPNMYAKHNHIQIQPKITSHNMMQTTITLFQVFITQKPADCFTLD